MLRFDWSYRWIFIHSKRVPGVVQQYHLSCWPCWRINLHSIPDVFTLYVPPGLHKTLDSSTRGQQSKFLVSITTHCITYLIKQFDIWWSTLIIFIHRVGNGCLFSLLLLLCFAPASCLLVYIKHSYFWNTDVDLSRTWPTLLAFLFSVSIIIVVGVLGSLILDLCIRSQLVLLIAILLSLYAVLFTWSASLNAFGMYITEPFRDFYTNPNYIFMPLKYSYT